MRASAIAVAAAAAAATVGAAPAATVRVDPWGSNAVRVRMVPPGGNPAVQPPLSGLGPTPPPAAPGASNIAASVDANGLVTVTRVSDGAVLVKQTGITYGAPPPGASAGTLSATVTFAGVDASERIFGFGEQQDGQVAKALPFFRSFEASEYYPFNHGSQALWGLFHSSKGYSFLWNMPTYGFLNMSTGGCTWFANGTQAGLVDIWVSTTPADLPAGSSPLAPLLSQYADAVGHTPQLPFYGTGFVASKDRYRNQSQLLEVARTYAALQLPISMIVVDWFHWPVLGDMKFDSACWPDPQGMVDELRSLGIELMTTFWPFVNGSSINYQTFVNNKWLAINRSSGYPDTFWGCAACQDSYGAMIDATQDAVQRAVFERWFDGYGRYGIRAVWLDETEPDRMGYTYGQWQLGAGADFEVGTAWKQRWIQTFAEGMAAANITEHFILSRSAWIGTNKFGNTLWSGDLGSTWAEFALQVAAGQGAGLSGQGYWTTDAGGYTGGDPADPDFQELFVRWMQFAAFSPVFRLHGHRQGGPPANECGGVSDSETGGVEAAWTSRPPTRRARGAC